MKTGRMIPRAAVLLALVLVFAFAGVALAADSVTLLGYQVDYLGFTDNGDDTSTWTYAVTGVGEETQEDLSHWTLGIDSCYLPIVAPADGSSYTTVTTGFGCGDGTYNCEQATCTVVHGLDDTTGISGIKFENCDPQLSTDPPQRTHIFQFTVSTVPNETGEVAVAMKPGNPTLAGKITGPACDPNAITLDGFSAQSGSSSLLLLGAGALGLAAVGLYLRRR